MELLNIATTVSDGIYIDQHQILAKINEAILYACVNVITLNMLCRVRRAHHTLSRALGLLHLCCIQLRTRFSISIHDVLWTCLFDADQYTNSVYSVKKA